MWEGGGRKGDLVPIAYEFKEENSRWPNDLIFTSLVSTEFDAENSLPMVFSLPDLLFLP